MILSCSEVCAGFDHGIRGWAEILRGWKSWLPGLERMSKPSVNNFAFKHPIGHLGEPDYVAWGIVYVASEEAKFVAGYELVIDGGYTAQ